MREGQQEKKSPKSRAEKHDSVSLYRQRIQHIRSSRRRICNENIIRIFALLILILSAASLAASCNLPEE
jgi:hypothetical protein